MSESVRNLLETVFCTSHRVEVLQTRVEIQPTIDKVLSSSAEVIPTIEPPTESSMVQFNPHHIETIAKLPPQYFGPQMIEIFKNQCTASRGTRHIFDQLSMYLDENKVQCYTNMRPHQIKVAQQSKQMCLEWMTHKYPYIQCASDYKKKVFFLKAPAGCGKTQCAVNFMFDRDILRESKYKSVLCVTSIKACSTNFFDELRKSMKRLNFPPLFIDDIVARAYLVESERLDIQRLSTASFIFVTHQIAYKICSHFSCDAFSRIIVDEVDFSSMSAVHGGIFRYFRSAFLFIMSATYGKVLDRIGKDKPDYECSTTDTVMTDVIRPLKNIHWYSIIIGKAGNPDMTTEFSSLTPAKRSEFMTEGNQRFIYKPVMNMVRDVLQKILVDDAKISPTFNGRCLVFLPKLTNTGKTISNHSQVNGVIVPYQLKTLCCVLDELIRLKEFEPQLTQRFGKPISSITSEDLLTNLLFKLPKQFKTDKQLIDSTPSIFIVTKDKMSRGANQLDLSCVVSFKDCDYDSFCQRAGRLTRKNNADGTPILIEPAYYGFLYNKSAIAAVNKLAKEEYDIGEPTLSIGELKPSTEELKPSTEKLKSTVASCGAGIGTETYNDHPKASILLCKPLPCESSLQPSKVKRPLADVKTAKKRHFMCILCGEHNSHYSSTCALNPDRKSKKKRAQE